MFFFFIQKKEKEKKYQDAVISPQFSKVTEMHFHFQPDEHVVR